MSWFWFSIIALLCWSGSDFFSKIGCRDASDKYSQYKMVTAVGVVMGIHAAIEIFVGGVEICYIHDDGSEDGTKEIILKFCEQDPARFRELRGPAQGGAKENFLWMMAQVDARIYMFADQDDVWLPEKIEKSLLALLLPIAYCILDAAGTFADDLVLETLNEDSANVAYELTFLVAGIVSFIYTVIIKKQKLLPKAEGPKYIGAAFETAGQLAYIYALASGESALAAPIIASYCMASVLWSRLFLKEKLSWKHYTCILVTFAGILIMGIYDM